MGVSIYLKILFCSVIFLESNVNSLPHIPHIKIELVKGKIEPF